MLDKQDIALLEGLFEKQEKRFDIKLENLKIDLRDEIHSNISASEARMIARMDAMEKRIVSDITDFIDDAILPQIEKHNVDIRHIKTHLNLA